MAHSLCRWGLMSTALIGHKNWQAIRLSGNGFVSGVASREVRRADSFVSLCQGACPQPTRPAVFQGYQALLDSPDIDAVYVPLPTALRKAWVIRAAEAGKHVLCEKPCAATADDLLEMIAACKANGVQFMDGVMFMHSLRLPEIRKALDDAEAVGDLKRITCQFSFAADEQWLASDIRTRSDLEPQGCLGDLGWYCIRFMLWILEGKLPERVTATILRQHQRLESPQPVPLEFSAELLFPGGVSGEFYCSFVTHHQQWAHLSGSRGCLRVDDFVLPYTGGKTRFEISNADFVMDKCDFSMHDHRRVVTIEEPGNSAPQSMESNMMRTFNQLVIDGTPDYRWADWSLATQRVMDACLTAARREDPVMELTP